MTSDNEPHVESASDLAARLRAEMENGDDSPTIAELLAEQLLNGDDTAIAKLVAMGPEAIMSAMEAMDDLAEADDYPLADFDADDCRGQGLPSDDLIIVDFGGCLLDFPWDMN
jgi:hypothetical protein